MNRRSLFLVGGTLILLGLLALLFMAIASALGFDLGRFVLRLWPVVVTGAGLGFVVPPFLARGNRGLSALFIPGMPILTTGGLLLLASVFNVWGVWAWLWPMLLISLAMGFLFAAVNMRLIWLLIPATIIGLNGLVFQFCAITGLWHWWSVLWVIEPLSVGLPLLVIGMRRDIAGLRTAGLILSGLAAALFMLMLIVLGAWLPLGLIGPGLLILVGLLAVGWGLLRSMLVPRSALE
ncbi:MAG: hypothetical protein P8189_22720 [Anaerolineae bacterium]|jgi:hypothetical protein